MAEGVDAAASAGLRLRSAVRGGVLGAVAGVVWWLAELVVHHQAGSLLPREAVAAMAASAVETGVAVGLLVGLLVPGIDAGALALCLGGAYGFMRVYSPPGMRAEALFVVVAVAAAWVGARLIGNRQGSALVRFVHVTLLAAAVPLLGELGLAEAHTAAAPAAWLLLAVAAAPLIGLALDRVVALVVPPRGRRLALELAIGLAAGWMLGRPLDPAPLALQLVTGIPPPAGTPDVILLSLDTTRADHLSAYGYERETSPNLTAFAADALLFEKAHSPAGWTLPAHASMLTGLYPSEHGAHAAADWLGGQSIDGRRNVAYSLPADRITVAEVLRDRGYHTGAFVANFSYLYRQFGLAQGFQIYDDAPRALLRLRSPLTRFLRALDPHFCLKPYRSGHEIATTALAWLDTRPRDRPAFLFLNFMDPHPPWLADPPFDGWARGMPSARLLAVENLYTHALRDYTPAERDFIVANYDGQVKTADHALGELVAGLKTRGRYENALIVVTADHGTLLGDHEQVGHIGRMLYESLLRVPLVVKFPGAERPRGRVATPVQSLDVFTTAIVSAGAPVPDGVHGQRLPDVTHPTLAEEDVNAYLVANYGALYDRAIRVLIDGKDKLIVTSRGERMLFDIAADPDEGENRAAREPGRTDALARELERLLPFDGAPPRPARQAG